MTYYGYGYTILPKATVGVFCSHFINTLVQGLNDLVLKSFNNTGLGFGIWIGKICIVTRYNKQNCNF